jgi:hypothetical protein
MSEFGFVADDIEWFADEWWGRRTDALSDGHIRRGSFTLATLLLDNMILRAWHHLGFTGEPQISGPDLKALASRQNLQLRHAAAVVAGGGREDGDELALVGAFRIDNPKTGTPADADEGFVVQNTMILRAESLARAEASLDADIEKLWSITEYLDAAAAVGRRRIITRRELLTFFREQRAGAVRVLPSPQATRQPFSPLPPSRTPVGFLRDNLHAYNEIDQQWQGGTRVLRLPAADKR